jgi:hypothetical protein
VLEDEDAPFTIRVQKKMFQLLDPNVAKKFKGIWETELPKSFPGFEEKLLACPPFDVPQGQSFFDAELKDGVDYAYYLRDAAKLTNQEGRSLKDDMKISGAQGHYVSSQWEACIEDGTLRIRRVVSGRFYICCNLNNEQSVLVFSRYWGLRMVHGQDEKFRKRDVAEIPLKLNRSTVVRNERWRIEEIETISDTVEDVQIVTEAPQAAPSERRRGNRDRDRKGTWLLVTLRGGLQFCWKLNDLQTASGKLNDLQTASGKLNDLQTASADIQQLAEQLHAFFSRAQIVTQGK